MPMFRKKPVVIEAEQLRWDNWGQVCNLIRKTLPTPYFRGYYPESDPNGIAIEIETPEGTMHGSENDWIIRDIKGEIYPCKPDIFDATYEPTTPATADAKEKQS